MLVRLRHGSGADDRPVGLDGFGECIWAELTCIDSLAFLCAVCAQARNLIPEILRASIRHELEAVAARAKTCLAELK